MCHPYLQVSELHRMTSSPLLLFHLSYTFITILCTINYNRGGNIHYEKSASSACSLSALLCLPLFFFFLLLDVDLFATTSSSSSPSDFLVCLALVFGFSSSDSGKGGEVENGEWDDLEEELIGITREAMDCIGEVVGAEERRGLEVEGEEPAAGEDGDDDKVVVVVVVVCTTGENAVLGEAG